MDKEQLLNLVTASFIRQQLDGEGGFRDHPLKLPVHEFVEGNLDFSKLTVELPPAFPREGKLKEPEEMMQPLAQLWDEVGGELAPRDFEYDWYYLELLDRDERVRPLCWVSSELLHAGLPDDRPKRVERDHEGEIVIRSRYAPQLSTTDVVHQWPPSSDKGQAERREWEDWLVRTWEANEADWLEQGLLRYDAVRPWSSMLAFSPALEEETEGAPRHFVEPDGPSVPYHVAVSSAGSGGLYWKMVPLYDQGVLPPIWHAMKQDLYVTSVFNIAAGAEQDKHLWRRLEERFRLRHQRMSRYDFLIDHRERIVEDLTKEGKSASEIARLLVHQKLHPFDPAGPIFATSAPPGQLEANLASARQVVVRIRSRLQREGRLQKLPAGRPKKAPNCVLRRA